MKHTILLALTVGIITSFHSLAAISQERIKPEDEIKFRQSGMTFMRWNMGKIQNQIEDTASDYNKEQVIAAANVINAIANSGIGTLFTPATETGKGWKETRVKPEFFKQPNEVKKLASAFIQESEKLVDVANQGDRQTVKSQFDSLFDACKACHKKFRSKD